MARLRKALGEVGASHVALRLWCDLAFAAVVHGQPGLLDAQDAKWLANGLEREIDQSGILDALLGARLLARDGDNYRCRLFAKSNPELSAGYLKPTLRASFTLAFNAKVEKATKRALDVAITLPAGCSLDDAGHPIPKESLWVAIKLILVCDSLLGLDTRSPSDFEPGIICHAHRLVVHYTPKQLEVILRRLHQRLRTDRETLPSTTAPLLRNFADVVALLFPGEGWAVWGMRNGLIQKSEEIQTPPSANPAPASA